MKGVPDEVAAEFADNPEIYNRLHNADTEAKAQASADKGITEATNDFNSMLDQMDPAAGPLAQKLAHMLSEQGDYAGGFTYTFCIS